MSLVPGSSNATCSDDEPPPKRKTQDDEASNGDNDRNSDDSAFAEPALAPAILSFTREHCVAGRTTRLDGVVRSWGEGSIVRGIRLVHDGICGEGHERGVIVECDLYHQSP